MAQNGGNSIPGGLTPDNNSAWEAFAKYFKNSQSVIGTLNPNIFWQLYNDANPPADDALPNEGNNVVEGEQQ